jgi:hypothetical protein
MKEEREVAMRYQSELMERRLVGQGGEVVQEAVVGHHCHFGGHSKAHSVMILSVSTAI